MPGPAGAIAAAPLGGGRIAVLAGDESAKAIFILNRKSGTVLRSFGTTKEATGIAAESEEGPLLVSVGVKDDGRLLGAIEQWSLEGTKERVVPMPTEALGITRIVSGTAYALLAGDGDVRAAMPIETPSLRTGDPIPLGAGARSLQLCRSDDDQYLLYTQGREGWLTLHSVSSGGELRSGTAAHGETCFGDGSVYAIVGNSLSRSVAIMRLPELGPVSSLPASRDAIALYETVDHRLVALNATDRIATIETFRTKSLEVETASNQWAAPEAR